MSGFSNIPSATRAFSTAAGPFPKKSKRRYTPPFSLRFTTEERKRLDELAGNQPLGSYIRNRLLGEQTEKRRKIKKPTPDTALLALVLGEFGRSRLASNINQLAKAANIGTLDVTPKTEREIVQACVEKLSPIHIRRITSSQIYCQIYLAYGMVKDEETVQPTGPKTVVVYQDARGKEPFTEWLDGLRDQQGRRSILTRVSRLE